MNLLNGGAIAAIIAASVSVITGIVLLIRWMSRKRLVKNPLEVTYLIPRNKYPAASFDGAPDEENTPKTLTVGIGRYFFVISV